MDIKPSENQSQNPLAKHFRQPAIYIKLPSQGQFWADGSLNLPANGEIGIMPMTTKDEITLKTPDALINGQGVIDVIKSCCPSIADPWQAPNIDVDSILIGIRIASYGNQMDFTSTCPHCEQSNDYAIDLGNTLSSVQAPDYNTPLTINGLKIKVKPQPYFSFNRTNMIAFEEQQLLRSLSNIESGSDPAGASEQFQKHLNKVIELNTALLSNSTESITTADGEVVTDQQHITEFYNNADNKMIKQVQDSITKLNESGAIKPVNVNCNNEECGKEFPISLTFDYASFFA